jgi:hypothetical protein
VRVRARAEALDLSFRCGIRNLLGSRSGTRVPELDDSAARHGEEHGDQRNGDGGLHDEFTATPM